MADASFRPSRSWPALVAFIAASFAAGAIGSWATFSSVRTWYPLLHQPVWNPPVWIFGPVWTLLYVLMGVAVWRAWGAVRLTAPAAGRSFVALYAAQLGINALWSVLFFGLRNPAWALADIVVLEGLLLWLQVRFLQVDRPAGLLWLPYVAWVSFAAALNTAIVRLN